MVINLNGLSKSPKLFSRLVWQELFNWYRTHNCSLEFMDSMLCDLYILERFFEDSMSLEYCKVLYWSGHGSYTSITEFPEESNLKIEFDNVKNTIEITEVK